MHQPEQFDADGDHGSDQRDARPGSVKPHRHQKNTIVPHSTEPPYFTTKRQAEAKSPSAQGEAAGDDGKAQAGAGDDGIFACLSQSIEAPGIRRPRRRSRECQLEAVP